MTTSPVATESTKEHGPDPVSVFQAVDAFDATSFAAFFAPAGQITFGNGDPLVGPETVEAGTAGFFSTIAGIRHELVHTWTVGADTLIELSVTYTRHDGGVVTVPVVSIWTVDERGLIADYRVFFDLTPVYA